MKKINGGYKSLFEYLVDREAKNSFHHSKYKIKLFRWIQETFYKEEETIRSTHTCSQYNTRYNETPRGKKKDQLIGSLQSFADMAHDAQYTFKRYRSWRDFFVDFFQPLRGVRNILQGITIGVGTLIYGVGAVISDLFRWDFDDLKKDLVNILSWFIDGGARIIRGSTQILATPFTWFLKMPIRTLKTFMKGTPDILENEDIQRLVALAEKGEVSSLFEIQKQLRIEYAKHFDRGQRSTLLPTLPDVGVYPNEETKKYIKLFKLVVGVVDAGEENVEQNGPVEFPDLR